MSEGFDLDAYFERIGYGGPASADFETLSAIHARQVDAIPFENLDPFTGKAPDLDPAALQAKLVGARRGGYCFELNLLFKGALDALGFQTTGLGARVRWGTAPDAPLGPRSHMLLKVDLPGGPYLADVGFGGLLLDAPLRFEADVEQPTPAGRFRLNRDGEGSWTLSAAMPEGWRTAYLFGSERQVHADYVMSNWFTATSPTSWFRSVLLMERVAPDARYSLLNRKLTETARGGGVRQREIDTAEAFAEALDRVFGVEPPAPAAELFERLSGG